MDSLYPSSRAHIPTLPVNDLETAKNVLKDYLKRETLMNV